MFNNCLFRFRMISDSITYQTNNNNNNNNNNNIFEEIKKVFESSEYFGKSAILSQQYKEKIKKWCMIHENKYHFDFKAEISNACHSLLYTVDVRNVDS